MTERTDAGQRRRGRPSKFGRPSRVVAVTLPHEAIERLRQVHRDLGWAIMALLDKDPPEAVRRPAARDAEPYAELVTVADRRALIVVNREHIRHLPGVNLIPMRGNRAFVALDIDRGMSDLELAVSDRLDESAVDAQERRALEDLRSQLTAWRRDHDLKFHRRAIIVVERRPKANGNGRRAPVRDLVQGKPSGR
ncbi:MAG TPA: hypothetical protein VH138_06380 [Vicinamibacterales bacterium]|nr:hypothetical protein [Vicinamibacterales bacterium]